MIGYKRRSIPLIEKQTLGVVLQEMGASFVTKRNG